MTEDRPTQHTPETFAAWLREMLERRGYTERGAQGRFAKDSGMPGGNLSRLLRASPGQPDIRTLEPIARTLNVPLLEVLVRASVLQQSDIDALSGARLDHAPITTERAAAELGITSTEGVQTFERMVNGLRATEPDSSTTRDRASG
ncbi:helix-turn-helix domain-containing protein [Streptomyces erythrochromogenes]|uniref:helix-turn-helix domain-containing protein n=1 Tax=Streptomyces erythrochromogenes TaxID=285574 RepID=UPI0036A63734